jgi:hypothetical protein
MSRLLGTGTDDSVAAEAAAGMPAAEEGTKVVAEGSVGDNQNASAHQGATSVQCSDQAPVAPKSAATHQQWSLESKVCALEVLNKVLPASARRQCIPAGPSVAMVMAAIKPSCAHHRYGSRWKHRYIGRGYRWLRKSQ